MSQTKAQLISDLVQALNFTGTASAPANGLFLSEANKLAFATASTERLKLAGSEVVVNETGTDTDFRVEGDTNINLLFCDAGNDRVGIGINDPATALSVGGVIKSNVNANGGTSTAIRTENGGTGTTIASYGFASGNSQKASIRAHVLGDGAMMFHNNNDTEKMRIDASGNLGLGVTSISDARFRIKGANNTTSAFNDGLMVTSNNESVYKKYSWMGIETQGGMHFSEVSGGKGETMRIDTSGRVGIGTTSPSTLLHVKSADNILATFESTDADALIEFKDNGTSDTILMGALGGDDLVLRCDPGNITFRLGNNSEKARFDSNGNLGIGTSNPGAKLQIATAAVDTDVFRIMRQDNTGISLFRIFQDSSSGGGAGGCHLNTNNRHLMITATTAASTTDSSGLYLKTTGELGVGTSSPSSSYQTTIQEGNTGNGCLLLDRTSNIDGTHRSMVSFERSGTQVGTILCSNSSTQFNTSSDHRLKENVVTMSNAIDRLKQLQPKRFNFILNPDIIVDGFLAHEVQSVVPEAISGTKDEVDSDNNPVYQGIDQSKLVPLLVAAVKELTARVETLEAA